jgi:hypothetical protein
MMIFKNKDYFHFEMVLSLIFKLAQKTDGSNTRLFFKLTADAG